MCRVLVVEDNAIEQSFLKVVLEHYDVLMIETLHDAYYQSFSPFDVIVLDLGLSDSFGIATFESMRKLFPSTPIIVCTADETARTALECIQHGAETVIVKPDYERLPAAIDYITARSQTHRALEDRVRTMTCAYRADVQKAKDILTETGAQLKTAIEGKRKWQDSEEGKTPNS